MFVAISRNRRFLRVGLVVLEAMKMEQPLTAHKAGTITGLNAESGTTVPSGTVLCEIKD